MHRSTGYVAGFVESSDAAECLPKSIVHLHPCVEEKGNHGEEANEEKYPYNRLSTPGYRGWDA